MADSPNSAGGDERRVIKSQFRVPADVLAAVKAEAEKRPELSVNAEIVTLLREALAARAKRRR